MLLYFSVFAVVILPGLVHRPVIGSNYNAAGGGGIHCTRMCSLRPRSSRKPVHFGPYWASARRNSAGIFWSRVRGNPGGGARTCCYHRPRLELRNCSGSCLVHVE